MEGIKLMKVKTRRTKRFPGDNWIGLDVILDDGRVFTPFGVYLNTDRQGRFYANDSTGAVYNTLADAKKAAIGKALAIIKP